MKFLIPCKTVKTLHGTKSDNNNKKINHQRCVTPTGQHLVKMLSNISWVSKQLRKQKNL